MKLRGNLGALLQLPEEGKKRGQCRSLLPGNQQKDSWEQLRAVPGEVQSKYQEKNLYHEGGETLEQTS